MKQAIFNENKINVKFSHKFPFINIGNAKKITEPNENFILELLANATIERIDKNKPSFLFHSAGKDSNTITFIFSRSRLAK